MGLSNYLKQQIVNLLCGNIDDVTNPGGKVYMGLSTTTPNADGTGITEPTDTAYARVLIGYENESLTKKMSSATESSPSSANTEPILFDKATENWGTITHVVFYNKKVSDANTKFLGFAALNESVTVSSGNVARIAIGNLTVSIS